MERKKNRISWADLQERWNAVAHRFGFPEHRRWDPESRSNFAAMAREFHDWPTWFDDLVDALPSFTGDARGVMSLRWFLEKPSRILKVVESRGTLDPYEIDALARARQREQALAQIPEDGITYQQFKQQFKQLERTDE